MDQLNPGIVKTVKLLNSYGFKTTDSGDGETHDHKCDRDEGYVVVVLEVHQEMVQSADTIYKLLKDRGVVDFGTEGGTLISSSYSPYDGFRLVDIHGIHDRMLNF